MKTILKVAGISILAVPALAVYAVIAIPTVAIVVSRDFLYSMGDAFGG